MLAVTYLIFAHTSMRALFPVGEASHDARAPPDLPVEPFDHVVRADAPAVSRRKLHPAGRWSSPGCPRAGSRRPPSASWPSYRTRRRPPCPTRTRVIPWRTGLQGRRRPFAVAGRHLGEHVAYEVHHAPLVSRLGKRGVDGGNQARAPVATTRRTPFSPRSIMERGTAPSRRNPPSCPRPRR